MKRVFAGVLLAAGLARAEAPAFVPVGLPHQGRLLDQADQPVTAVQEVTFALYKAPAGGAPVWKETRRVSFQNGYYAVLLGEAQEAPAVSSPIDPSLFGDQLYLGVQPQGAAAEMSPRLRLGTVPYAHRAELAADALKLGGRDAASYQLKSEALGQFLRKAGDQMTGDLAVQGGVSARDSVQAAQLVSTATAVAPFVVSSSELVAGLNAEMVGGKRAADLLTVASFTETSLANQVRNSSFEKGTDGQLPQYFEAYGAGTGSRGLVSGQGRFGTRVVQVNDSDTAQTVAVKQVLLPSGQAQAYAGVRFTASVLARKIAGASGIRGQLCLADKGADDAEPSANKDCVDLSEATDWTRVSVTHQVAADADYLAVILSPTRTPADAATYQFDALAVNSGPVAPQWSPHPTEQLYDGGLLTEKVADQAITTAKIAQNAITSDRIADGAVGTSDLAQNAVTSDRIADGAVGTVDLAQGAVTGAKLASDAASLAQVSAGALKIQNGNLVVTGNVGINVANPQRTLDLSGSFGMRNGQDQRNVLTFQTTENNSIPIHIKTNWRTNNSAMYRFILEGYNYGRAAAIFNDCVGYLYETTDTLYNTSCNQYAGGVTFSQYKSSDGYLVLKVDPINTNYFIGFGLSVQQYNPTGVAPALQFTVVRQLANL